MSSQDSEQITDEALASSISDDGRLSSEAFADDEEGIVEAGIPPQSKDASDDGELDEEAFSVDDFDADRTKVLRAQGYTCRNLREAQMTTPTAVCVSHRILHRKVPFDELRFVDRPEFETDGAETLMMPFRYLADSSTGKPIMADGILDLLTSDLEWDISDLQ